MRYKSSIISDAAGKIGGSVFQHSAVGSVVRRTAAPVKHASYLQQQRKQQHAKAAAIWRTLSFEQREGWKHVAADVVRYNKFGERMSPSGYGLFMSRAKIAQSMNFAIREDAAPLTYVPAPKVFLELVPPQRLFIRKLVPVSLPGWWIQFALARQIGSAGGGKRLSYRIVYQTTWNFNWSVNVQAYLALNYRLDYRTRYYFARYRLINQFTFQAGDWIYLSHPPVQPV